MAPELLDAVAEAALPYLEATSSKTSGPTFAPRDLARLLWAFAVLQHPAPRLFEAASGAVASHAAAGDLRPEELINTVWAFAAADDGSSMTEEFCAQISPVLAALPGGSSSNPFLMHAEAAMEVRAPGLAPNLPAALLDSNKAPEEDKDGPAVTPAGGSGDNEAPEEDKPDDDEHENDANDNSPTSSKQRPPPVCPKAVPAPGHIIEAVQEALQALELPYQRQEGFRSGPFDVEVALLPPPSSAAADDNTADDAAAPGLQTMGIAVEVEGPASYTRTQPYSLLGYAALRHRLLRAQGWEVWEVPFHEWSNQLGDADKQREYLRQKLIVVDKADGVSAAEPAADL